MSSGIDKLKAGVGSVFVAGLKCKSKRLDHLLCICYENTTILYFVDIPIYRDI